LDTRTLWRRERLRSVGKVCYRANPLRYFVLFLLRQGGAWRAPLRGARQGPSDSLSGRVNLTHDVVANAIPRELEQVHDHLCPVLNQLDLFRLVGE